MTLDQWVQLAKRVNEIFEADPEPDGRGRHVWYGFARGAGIFPSSHGPNDQSRSCWSARCGTPERPATKGPRTCWMRSASRRPATRAARACSSCLNDEINSAREVSKTDALRVQTFQSRQYGILGVVDPDRVVYYREPRQAPHSEDRVRRVRSLASLPRVDIMMFYQGASSDLLRAAVDAGAKGIVIAVAGADLTGGSLASGHCLRRASRRDRRRRDENRQRPNRGALGQSRARRNGRRRGSDAAEGAHPADARADENAITHRHPANVHRTERRPYTDIPTWNLAE